MLKACRPHTEQTFTNSERAEYIEPILINTYRAFDRAIDMAATGKDWERHKLTYYWSALAPYVRIVLVVSLTFSHLCGSVHTL